MKTTRQERARRAPMAAAASRPWPPEPWRCYHGRRRRCQQPGEGVGADDRQDGEGARRQRQGALCPPSWEQLRLVLSEDLASPHGVRQAKGATAGSGVQKSKLGVTTDSAGAKQVTYDGMPVYWFSGDSKGTVKGNVTDQWGKWTAVVVAKPKHASTGSSGGSV